MKTESKPTSSARHEKPSNLPGANCSADALYPSLITAPLLAGAVAPAAEVYRLEGNRQPAQVEEMTCISDLPCPSATSVAMARSCANSLSSPRPRATMA